MAQSLITSETYQWLTRNWQGLDYEPHDHLAVLLQLSSNTKKKTLAKRLEETPKAAEKPIN